MFHIKIIKSFALIQLGLLSQCENRNFLYAKYYIFVCFIVEILNTKRLFLYEIQDGMHD